MTNCAGKPTRLPPREGDIRRHGGFSERQSVSNFGRNLLGTGFVAPQDLPPSDDEASTPRMEFDATHSEALWLLLGTLTGGGSSVGPFPKTCGLWPGGGCKGISRRYRRTGTCMSNMIAGRGGCIAQRQERQRVSERLGERYF